MSKKWILQILIILICSTIAAVALNTIRSGGVALVGNWPSRTAVGDEAVIPPSAEEGDPPFITLDDAVARYQSPDVVFIDARDPEDFDYGHIRRAINIPFDFLDEYWEAYIDTLDRTVEYIIYCSGTECESSLFLGRYLQTQGFGIVRVFYGGWAEWSANNLPIVGEGAVSEESGS